MVVALIALVFSTTGLADAARHAVVSGDRRAPDQHQAPRRRAAAARQEREIPGRRDPDGQERRARRGRQDRRTDSPAPARPRPSTSAPGAWTSAPYPLTKADAGKNNFIWASKACEAEGGWLPSAAELLGAAERVKLESTIHDSPLTATINLDPSRGLKDEREMSSTLVTTEAGSAAAGFEGVSEGATGNPRQGQANPVPLPANPLPESLQYVTVYDNGNKGGFAGSEPVSEPRELPLRLQPRRRARSTNPNPDGARRARAPSETHTTLAARRSRRRRGARVMRLAGRARGRVILPATTIDGPSEEIVGFGGVAMAEDGTRRGRVPQARRRRPARVRLALRRRALAGADPGRRRRAVRRELAAHRRRRRRRAGRRVGDAVRDRANGKPVVRAARRRRSGPAPQRFGRRDHRRLRTSKKPPAPAPTSR